MQIKNVLVSNNKAGCDNTHPEAPQAQFNHIYNNNDTYLYRNRPVKVLDITGLSDSKELRKNAILQRMHEKNTYRNCMFRK